MKMAVKFRIVPVLLGSMLFVSFGIVCDRAEAQVFTVLHFFSAGAHNSYSGAPTNGDGISPWSDLIQSGNILYGTAFYGGTNGFGTVFAIGVDGAAFKVLHEFSTVTGFPPAINSDGAEPVGALLLANNVLYGTSIIGGTNGAGTVFALGADGAAFTNLYTFTGGTDGYSPFAGLLLSGNTLYGTTVRGGASNNGTVFAVNTDGTGFTNLHSFTGGNDGGVPYGTLVLSAGTLFGTASAGGTNDNGTVFAIETDGSHFTNLHSFTALSTPYPEMGTNRDGANPYAGLSISGGRLYGTTKNGGVAGSGTVFAENTDGSGFTNLYSFTGGNDGANPYGGLILRGNTLFGTTRYGGTNGTGTVFALNADGTGFTNLHSFSALSAPPYDYKTNADGANPYAGLVLSDNILYGTAYFGGTNAGGTIFSLRLPLPPDLNIALAGTNVILTWPTNAIIYTLQSATSLVPPVVWNPVSPSPAILNGQNTVTNPLAAMQMFYRLSQ